MCMVITKSIVTEKDMIVWKIARPTRLLRVYRSLHNPWSRSTQTGCNNPGRSMSYVVGRSYISKFPGYYAYTSKSTARAWPGVRVLKCLVPAGSRAVIGTFNRIGVERITVLQGGILKRVRGKLEFIPE